MARGPTIFQLLHDYVGLLNYCYHVFATCHLAEREREKTPDIIKITRKVEIPKHNKHAERAARRAQKIAKQQEGNVLYAFCLFIYLFVCLCFNER